MTAHVATIPTTPSTVEVVHLPQAAGVLLVGDDGRAHRSPAFAFVVAVAALVVITAWGAHGAA